MQVYGADALGEAHLADLYAGRYPESRVKETPELELSLPWN
jgi:hypothetical protein